MEGRTDEADPVWDGRDLTRRRPLSRTLIVSSAIGYVDREGLTALTMRRLGRELGVEAMSLYRYVTSREDLLEAMVDRLTQQLHLDRATTRPSGAWQAYLMWLAHATRGLALEHPQIFPLIATRHPAAPWLRPPLRSLTVVEDFLSCLTGPGGFSDEDAVAAYRAFSSFLLGHLLLETAQRSAHPTLAEEQLESRPTRDCPLPGVDGTVYPTIARLGAGLARDESRTEFEITLEDLIERLTRMAG